MGHGCVSAARVVRVVELHVHAASIATESIVARPEFPPAAQVRR